MVHPLIWSIFGGQTEDHITGPHCIHTTALLNPIQMWRMGNAGDDGAGAPDEMDNLRSSRGETVC